MKTIDILLAAGLFMFLTANLGNGVHQHLWYFSR